MLAKKYTIGELVNKFDLMETQTVRSFEIIFKIDLGIKNKKAKVEILGPCENDGRYLSINGIEHKIFFDKYLTDSQIDREIRKVGPGDYTGGAADIYKYFRKSRSI